MIEISRNEEKNGVQISFPDKPDSSTLVWLKDNRWRWSRYAKVWYKKFTQHDWAMAHEKFGEGSQPAAPPVEVSTPVEASLSKGNLADIARLVQLQYDKQNKVPNGWDMNLFKSSFANKVKRMSQVDADAALLLLIEGTQKKHLKPVFTQAHSIYKYHSDHDYIRKIVTGKGKPVLTYEDVEKLYRSYFKELMKYSPNEVGSGIFAEKMAKLSDEYPEWIEKIDAEEEKYKKPASVKITMPTIKSSDDELMNEFLEGLQKHGLLEKNPLQPDVLIYKDKANLEFSRFNLGDSRAITLQDIAVFDKGQGVGKEVMQDITDTADELGFELKLYAKPFGTDEKSLRKGDLIGFYRKFGFTTSPEQYGMDSIEEIETYVMKENDEGLGMSREPKSKPISQAAQDIIKPEWDKMQEFLGNTDFMKTSMLLGREITISMPNGEKHNAQFAIVELDKILASHNEENFHSTKGYPTNSQGNNINDRNYSGDPAAQKAVMGYAKNLEPERLITTSRTPSGTPIISKDGFVVSGNNRTMSLKLAESKYPDNYLEYKKFLRDEISSFGFDGIRVQEYQMNGKLKDLMFNKDGLFIDSPVLVRIDYDFPEYTTHQLAKYNQDTKKAERPIDKAIKLSSILRDNPSCANIISQTTGDFDTFSEFYASIGAEKKLAAELVSCNLLTEQELPAYFSGASFTEQGKEFVENILAALILDRNALMASEVAGVKSMKQKLITSLPVLMKNANLPEGSLKQNINDAVILEQTIKASGNSFTDWIRQHKMFGETYDRKTIYLNRLLNSGKLKFKKAIEGYNNRIVESQGESLFGEKPSLDEVFDYWIKQNIDGDEMRLIESSAIVEGSAPEKNSLTESEIQDFIDIIDTNPEDPRYDRYRKMLSDAGIKYVNPEERYKSEITLIKKLKGQVDKRTKDGLNIILEISPTKGLLKSFTITALNIHQDDILGRLGANIDLDKKELRIGGAEVNPEYRRKGVYSTMIDRVESIAINNNLEIVDSGKSEDAKAFWKNRVKIEPETTVKEPDEDSDIDKTQFKPDYLITSKEELIAERDRMEANWNEQTMRERMQTLSRTSLTKYNIPLTELKIESETPTEMNEIEKYSVDDTVIIRGKNGVKDFEASFRGYKGANEAVVYDMKRGDQYQLPVTDIIGKVEPEKKELTELEDHIRLNPMIAWIQEILNIDDVEVLEDVFELMRTSELYKSERFDAEAKRAYEMLNKGSENDEGLFKEPASQDKFVIINQNHLSYAEGTIGRVIKEPNMFVKELYFGKNLSGQELKGKVDNTYLATTHEPVELVIEGESEKFVFKQAAETSEYLPAWKYTKLEFDNKFTRGDILVKPAKPEGYSSGYMVDDYESSMTFESAKTKKQAVRDFHYQQVHNAIIAGEPVEDRVKDDYPEMISNLKKSGLITLIGGKPVKEPEVINPNEPKGEVFENLRAELETATGEDYSDEAVYEHIEAAGGLGEEELDIDEDWDEEIGKKYMLTYLKHKHKIMRGFDLEVGIDKSGTNSLLFSPKDADIFIGVIGLNFLIPDVHDYSPAYIDDLKTIAGRIVTLSNPKKAVETKEIVQVEIIIIDYYNKHGKSEAYLYNNRNKGLNSKEQYDANHKWISEQGDTKEPWEMTEDEYVEDQIKNHGGKSGYGLRKMYKDVVEEKNKQNLPTISDSSKDLLVSMGAGAKHSPLTELQNDVTDLAESVRKNRDPQKVGELLLKVTELQSRLPEVAGTKGWVSNAEFAIKLAKNIIAYNPNEEDLTTKEYKNPYLKNKAIEQLLDKKWSDTNWTEQELAFIKGYTGKGGLKDEILAEGDKFDKGVKYEFYTPAQIIQKMWDLARYHGYDFGPVLETSAGIGSFFDSPSVKDYIVKEAYEPNKYSAKICKLLYPDVTVNKDQDSMYFEELFIKGRWTVKDKVLPRFQLVIGNPPYGAFKGTYAALGEKDYTNATSWIDYFIFRGLDMLETGGLLVFIIGTEAGAGGTPWLDQDDSKCKQAIAKKGELIDAYRLPADVFDRTGVVADIIVMKRK